MINKTVKLLLFIEIIHQKLLTKDYYLKLKNIVFDKLPNFYTKAIEHTDEDSGQEGNDDEYQLHGFYVIEANDNTYMNIEGVDLRVKYNHMYILPGRAIYKYNKGSNVKVITMKWKLKELPKLKENGVTYGWRNKTNNRFRGINT